MRIRISTSLAWLTLALLCFPAGAVAGGIEFPGDGTRGLGRGGAIMARPDDPFVMARNPALLSDLWGSQLYISTQIGMPHNCSQLSGGWGWGYESNTESVVSTGKGEPPLYAKAEEGSKGGVSEDQMFDILPSKVPYIGEPYPEICYSAGATLLPNVILSTRINEKIGVGIGFMPPELYQNSSMGGSNGLINTPFGLRPNPLRYIEPAVQDVTYFGLLGAIGYRVLPWLRLGAGFRWTMIMANAEVWANANTDAEPMRDVRTDTYSQDLFIPGFTTSIHAVPIDSVDVAVGFRWEDQLRMNIKLDTTSAPHSFYSTEDGLMLYQDPSGMLSTIPNFYSVAGENSPGTITTPPAVVPQLSFGIRYADRIRPRPKSYVGLDKAKDPVRDPMADENWDIEFDAIYYFTSMYDTQSVITPERLLIHSNSLDLQADGTLRDSPGTFETGKCLVEKDSEGRCPGSVQQVPRDYFGKDQMSLRLGGDYNAIPNVLALRLGGSYESRGQEPGYVRPSWSMPFERFGIHTGFTWRVDGRTDISFGYAHFFQETIKLGLNPGDGNNGFPPSFERDPETNQWLEEDEIARKYHVVPENEQDGVAMIPIHSGYYTSQTGEWGKYYANAGTHKSGLDVFSVSIMRHF